MSGIFQFIPASALTVAEANALARLNELSSSLWRIQTLNDGLGEMLDATMELLKADKGTFKFLTNNHVCLELFLNGDLIRSFWNSFAK